MSAPFDVISRSPGDCSDSEIEDFMALVLAGGEVTGHGLKNRIRSAACLFLLRIGSCTCGIAALKKPAVSYRKHVSLKSGIPLPQDEYPYELGWVFVMPSARGHHFSRDLTRAAISRSGTSGVFATSRTGNDTMHATLKKFDFVAAGRSWPSERGGHNLQLFVRGATKADTVVKPN